MESTITRISSKKKRKAVERWRGIGGGSGWKRNVEQ